MHGLEIGIGWTGGAIERVELRSHRPDTSCLLPGRTPDEALALLGRLYTVCGHAQRAAAELALGAALGRPPTATRREQLLRECGREAVQEHLWRLLVDWPKKLGLPPLQERFAHWYRRCSGMDAEWPAALLDEIAAAWLASPLASLDDWADLRAFDAWSARGDAALAPLFRALAAAPALRGCTTPAPAPERSPEETGPFVQHAEHPWLAALVADGRPVAARVAARLVGLVATAGNLAGRGDPDLETEFDADAPAPRCGTSIVTTARGLLVHEVRIGAERIERYAIQTPTDRNFGAHGAYVARVEGLPVADAAAAVRLADLWALALDPCVPYRVGVAGSAVHA